MEQRQRATFDADELAVVLSHYRLGVIESITEFAKGSRRSPKVGIVCQRGKFLLKRQAASRVSPDRIQFGHRLQSHLVDAGFPAPRLIPTHDEGPTVLQIRDRFYELFEFVAGQPYRRTPAETQDAGAVLAHFHQVTEQFPSGDSTLFAVPRGDYHDAAGVRTGLCAIGSTLSSHDSFTGDEAELAGLIQFVLEAYDRAAEAVNALGMSGQPERIIHSDWHPGNLLFRHQKRVVAAVDFDSARLSRRVVDVANGVLQFSMLAGGTPSDWPDHLDEERFDAFLSGYESRDVLSDAELPCIPHLMIEALIAECVHPIAQTGSIGRWAGYRVLQMIRRKVTWLGQHGARLLQAVRR